MSPPALLFVAENALRTPYDINAQTTCTDFVPSTHNLPKVGSVSCHSSVAADLLQAKRCGTGPIFRASLVCALQRLHVVSSIRRRDAQYLRDHDLAASLMRLGSSSPQLKNASDTSGCNASWQQSCIGIPSSTMSMRPRRANPPSRWISDPQACSLVQPSWSSRGASEQLRSILVKASICLDGFTLFMRSGGSAVRHAITNATVCFPSTSLHIIASVRRGQECDEDHRRHHEECCHDVVLLVVQLPVVGLCCGDRRHETCQRLVVPPSETQRHRFQQRIQPLSNALSEALVAPAFMPTCSKICDVSRHTAVCHQPRPPMPR